MLFLAADHAGFEQKEEIKKILTEKGVEFEDVGPSEYDPADDYPDYGYPAVAKMDPELDRAILFCGSGGGMVILANKLKGIRAIQAWNEDSAKAGRLDDNSNVLAIAGRLTPMEETKRIVDVWLGTPFSEEERHIRRLTKIKDLEDRLSSGPGNP